MSHLPVVIFPDIIVGSFFISAIAAIGNPQLATKVHNWNVVMTIYGSILL